MADFSLLHLLTIQYSLCEHEVTTFVSGTHLNMHISPLSHLQTLPAAHLLISPLELPYWIIERTMSFSIPVISILFSSAELCVFALFTQFPHVCCVLFILFRMFGTAIYCATEQSQIFICLHLKITLTSNLTFFFYLSFLFATALLLYCAHFLCSLFPHLLHCNLNV